MKSEDFQRTLVEGCRLLRIDPEPDSIRLLAIYHSELIRWSKKINLIGKQQGARQIVENHFLDSLLLLSHLNREDETLVDVGTGAGFPGLVCKAALPSLRLILIEPRLKRVSFLRHVIRRLGLANTEVIAARVEDVDAKDLSRPCITSRAVAEIEDFVTMVGGLVSEDSRLLCMKGPKWRQELDRAMPVLNRLGLVCERVEEAALPFSGAYRAVVQLGKDK